MHIPLVAKAPTPAATAYAAPALVAGHLMLDTKARTAAVKGRPLALTGREYDVLELLLQRKGIVLTKAAFLGQLYAGRQAPEAKIIDVFICKLRRKLGRAGAEGLIATIRGRGYVLRDPPILPAAIRA
jgi:two-component system cell cycle response regulator CtrA